MQRQPGVLVTVVAVRGHAPREAGAKMVVGERRCWGTIGGGNLEQTAVVQRARDARLGGVRAGDDGHEPLRAGARAARRAVLRRRGHVLFEPLRPVPAIAVFGVGHVGTELALVLCRHDIELHLVDSRGGHVDPERLAPVTDNAVARVHLHHAVGARAGARRAARRQPRAGHDARPRRGRRAV